MDVADAWVADRWSEVVAAWPWPEDERSFFTVAVTIAFAVGYWVPNILLGLVWRFNLFSSWKINPAGKEPGKDLVRENIIAAMFGVFGSGPLLVYFLLYTNCEGSIFTQPPPLTTWAWQLVAFWLINDTWFYWGHRLCHDNSGEGKGLGSAAFYQRVHKKHHRFTWTVGLAATGNQDILEEIFVNMPSTLGPPAIVAHFTEVHAAVYLFYFCTRMIETTEGHSGYSNPLSLWHYLRSNDYHAYHHRYYNKGNFGIFPMWDSICGTNKAYYRDRARDGKRWWQ